MQTQKNRKKKVHSITLSPESHENLKKIAQKDGRTLSGYLDYHFHPDTTSKPKGKEDEE